MQRKLGRAFVAVSLPATLLTAVTTVSSADADPAVTTISWPGVIVPYAEVDSHGDGSITLASNDCSGCTYGSTVPSAVTYSSDYSQSYTITKDTSGWDVVQNANLRVMGSDQNVYFMQENPSTGVNRVIAMRDFATLWTAQLSKVCGYKPTPYSMGLGSDNNLYLELSTSCSPSTTLLKSIDAATGYVNFTATLPASNPQGLWTGDVMPYNGGVAVANGNSIYYYDANGNLESDKTFVAPSSATIYAARVAPDGRTYMVTSKATYPNGVMTIERHLYYKDLTSSTSTEISMAYHNSLSNVLYVGPNDTVVARWTNGGHTYIGYFNSDSSEAFEADMSAENGLTLVNGSLGVGVDNLGNVIVQRTMDNGSERNVYLDSFSPNGVETHLFNSATQFGTAGFDLFTSSSWSTHSIGNGQFYMVLCHRTTAPSGTWPTTCANSDNPSIVAIPVTGQFDYSTSELYAALAQKATYVAMGDSYSSGEGNPPFITPTDNVGGNGCDRSYNAYPVTLARAAGLNLTAFVACSGETTDNMDNSGNSGVPVEPAQVLALDDSTQLITITAGGNDAYFADFAEKCVVSTCDTNSLEYQNSMEVINNLLPGSLDTLFADISDAAPNAQVYVVGYPHVAPPSGVSCTWFADSERTAATNIVDGLNADSAAAVERAGANFHFIDPTDPNTPGNTFIGHEDCTADSYFFGVNGLENRFSFHPNAEGMVAYEELIASNI